MRIFFIALGAAGRGPGEESLARADSQKGTTRLTMLLLVFLSAQSFQPLLRPTSPLPAARLSPPSCMARWTTQDMRAKRARLPPEVDGLLSADTPRESTEALWAALRACYANEASAVAAATRNTGTILPYLNSPSNIYGCYDVLVGMLGTEGARDVCSKNPGILQCNPRTLALEEPSSIVAAAEQVDFFERGVLGRLPPALRQNLDKVAFMLLAVPIAKRLADCAGQTCGL